MDTELKYLVDTQKYDEELSEEGREIVGLIDTLKEMTLVDRRPAMMPSIIDMDNELSNLYSQRDTLEEKINALQSKLKDSSNFIIREAKLDDEKELIRAQKELEELEASKKRYAEYAKKIDDQRLSLEKVLSDISSRLERHKRAKNEEMFRDRINRLLEQKEDNERKMSDISYETERYDKLLEGLNQRYDLCYEKIQALKNKIASDDAYIDEDKKNILENELYELISQNAEITERISNLKNHPVYLASVCRIPLKGQDIEYFKEILNKIYNLAKNVPYMDTPQQELESLDEVEKNIIPERDKANKARKANKEAFNILKKRVENLEFDQTAFEQTIDNEINAITNRMKDLAEGVKKADNEVAHINEEIDFRTTKYNPELETEKTKNDTNIKNLQKQLDVLNKILDNYFDEIELLSTQKNILDNVKGIISNLKLLYNSSQSEEIKNAIPVLKDINIPSLVQNSERQQEVQKLMLDVMGIKHRRKFENSASEIYEQIITKLQRYQTTKVEKDKTIPVQEEDNLEQMKLEDTVAPVPVVDLSDTIDETEDKEYGMDSSINAPFETPVEYQDTEVEVPGFNPLDTTASQPVVTEDKTLKTLDDGSILRVDAVENLGEEKEKDGHQAGFSDIIPQDEDSKELTTTGADFADLDRFLNGEFTKDSLGLADGQGMKR